MEDTFTATAGQTSFVPSSGYVPGNIDVYRNGVKLANGLEFTASDGITVVLNNACAAGDSVVLLSYIPRGLSDGYTKPEADSRYFAQSSSMGFRNRIINGDMRIDQRNNGASVTPTTDSQFPVDRFKLRLSQASKFSAQRNADSISPPPGFSTYLGFTSLSAYSVSASDFFALGHNIEGLNIADWSFGTSAASPITLSFWVRSTLTGQFSGVVFNNGNTRNYNFIYTINAANTWEYKTITIPGDTGGTWLTDTNNGLLLLWSLGAGSTLTGAAQSWSATNYVAVSGSVNLVGTNGAKFYITGVQLEKGSVATPFEFRSIGQELALCQRYHQRFLATANSSVTPLIRFLDTANDYVGSFAFPVTMRATPTASVTTVTLHKPGVRYDSVTSVGSFPISEKSCSLSAAPSTNDSSCRMLFYADGFVILNAEL